MANLKNKTKITKHFDFVTPLTRGMNHYGDFEISGIGYYDKSPEPGEDKITYDIEQIFFTDKNGVRVEVSIPMIEGLFGGDIPEMMTMPTFQHLLKVFITNDIDTVTDRKQDSLTKEAA